MKKILETIKKKWAEYLLEIIVIMIGILGAYSLNNWNESRKLLAQEEIILNELNVDFNISSNRLKETLFAQKRVLNCSKLLIEVHEGSKNLYDVDSLNYLIQYGAFAWYRAEPVTGAYDALINSGNFELLRNKELRQKLAEFHSILESGFEDHQSSMDLMDKLFIEASNVLLSTSETNIRESLGLKAPATKNPEGLNKLLKSESFFGYLYYKTIWERNRHKRQQDMADLIKEIQSVLNVELSRF